MSWLKWAEDKLFKFSRVTHVANAYKEDIWVKVLADIRYLEKDYNINIGQYGLSSGNNIWEKCEKNGFTKIIPDAFVAFEPDTSNSANVYITIVTESGAVICNALPKTVNSSVVVDGKGQVWSKWNGQSAFMSWKEDKQQFK